MSRSRLAINILLVLIFGAAAIQALEFPTLARYFPLGVGVGGFLASAVALTGDLVRQRSAGTDLRTTSEARPEDMESGPSVLRFILWFGGYAVAIRLIGIGVASLVFVAVFLRIEAQISKTRSVLGAIATVLLLLALVAFLDLRLPRALWDPMNL